MFKRTDYIIFAIICFILGIFLVSQYFAGKQIKRISQPESSEVLALEVAKLTKSNADLRHQASILTTDLDKYQNSKEVAEKAKTELESLRLINAENSASGQGVLIKIDKQLSQAQLVDLINALKNIGTYLISVNNQRITPNYFFPNNYFSSPYEIRALGNKTILENSLNRKGGIVEQIAGDDRDKFIVEQSDSIVIPQSQPIIFKFATIE
jgi:uncharacterized protein YlxW (UPF0749 family)